jgi:hypothetical protein
MRYHFEDITRRDLLAQISSEMIDRNPGMNQRKIKGVLLSE